jgi:hypothetical protein
LRKPLETNDEKRMRTALLLCAALLMSACQTGYQPSGLGGGFSESRIDENTWRVSFRGNAFTSPDTVEKYVLYRCAEITVQNGYDWFLFVDRGTDARYTPPSGSGVTAMPGYRKYRSSAEIRAFRGQKPADNLDAHDAREVMKFLGPSIGR